MTLWKEPFVHFALLGAAIFGWFALTNPNTMVARDPDEIVVDEQIVTSLIAQFDTQMKRSPTPREADAIVDAYIRTEIMVREARALGLDQGDGVVRNRLVQKMSFLTTSAAQSAVPDDATLEKHLQKNADKFLTDASATFEQYALEEGADEASATRVLTLLKAGEAPTEGIRFQLLPSVVEKNGERQVDGRFGRGFFAAISELPIGEWAGPVRSGFGLHIVRLIEFKPGSLPSLDAVRDSVLFDWRRTLEEQLTEAQIAAMTERYSVTRPSPEDLQGWITP